MHLKASFDLNKKVEPNIKIEWCVFFLVGVGLPPRVSGGVSPTPG